MTRPTIVNVVGCADCPFALPQGRSLRDEPLLCTAHAKSRTVSLDQAVLPEGGIRRPPRWCPLRRCSHLIRLGAR